MPKPFNEDDGQEQSLTTNSKGVQYHKKQLCVGTIQLNRLTNICPPKPYQTYIEVHPTPWNHRHWNQHDGNEIICTGIHISTFVGHLQKKQRY